MPHIPPHVYIPFLVLLSMGISRCYPRTIRIGRLLIMPFLMVVVGVRGFMELFPFVHPSSLLAGVAGAVLGIMVGYHHVRRWTISVDRAAGTLSVPGDVMMFVIILSSFLFEVCLHYLVESGTVSAGNLLLQVAAAAIWALFAGMSVGRNLNLSSRFFKADLAAPQVLTR
ncbi:hypothetical protein [Oryzifoliimicrobium ureilyticus]|uniref:hypothetical protein n=1 Tax=Oryzifoliimicrobium ureilyticus TaxID=3113724 RepID=UPI0030762CE1